MADEETDGSRQQVHQKIDQTLQMTPFRCCDGRIVSVLEGGYAVQGVPLLEFFKGTVLVQVARPLHLQRVWLRTFRP